jgi:hypothetical protein
MAMNTPVALVTAALTAAILLTATFLIATGTRGEGAPSSVILTPHRNNSGEQN